MKRKRLTENNTWPEAGTLLGKAAKEHLDNMPSPAEAAAAAKLEVVAAKEIEQQHDMLDAIAAALTAIYLDGSLTFAKYTQGLRTAAKKAELPTWRRERTIGHWFLAAVEGKPAKNSKRGPKATHEEHKKLMRHGLAAAHDMGLVANREPASGNGENAYQWVAKYLSDWGLPTSVSDVESCGGRATGN